MAFLKYEDVLVKVGNDDIFADTASINVEASLSESRNI